MEIIIGWERRVLWQALFSKRHLHEGFPLKILTRRKFPVEFIGLALRFDVEKKNGKRGYT